MRQEREEAGRQVSHTVKGLACEVLGPWLLCSLGTHQRFVREQWLHQAQQEGGLERRGLHLGHRIGDSSTSSAGQNQTKAVELSECWKHF